MKSCRRYGRLAQGNEGGEFAVSGINLLNEDFHDA